MAAYKVKNPINKLKTITGGESTQLMGWKHLEVTAEAEEVINYRETRRVRKKVFFAAAASFEHIPRLITNSPREKSD